MIIKIEAAFNIQAGDTVHINYDKDGIPAIEQNITVAKTHGVALDTVQAGEIIRVITSGKIKGASPPDAAYK